jgi:lysine-specific demethylase/histidyl-hydroxylase NO66
MAATREAVSPFPTLARLVAPLGLDEFLRDYYDQQAIHLPGAAARVRDLLSHERLSALLRQSEQARGQVFSFPCAVGDEDDPVAAYLDAGYPIIWNAARGVTPEIDRVCADLGAALQAHVWPNVYATGTAGAPLNMHFDPHEVLVVQCEGEKEWRISSLRANRPLDVEEMRATNSAAVEATREQALANISMTFTVKPGDVVYIPRGQFHVATTPRGRSLHVTFAIRQLAGYDLAKALGRLALSDPRLRDYLPLPLADPDGTRAALCLAEFKGRLRELLDGPHFDQTLAAVRAELIARSNGTGKA